MPASGSLREQIRFERRVETNDGYGNTIGSWATFVAGVAASVVPVRGTEEIIAGKLTGTLPIIISTRWQAALAEGEDRLTTADRAVNARSGDAYDIRSIEADPRRQWLTLTCEAGGVA